MYLNLRVNWLSKNRRGLFQDKHGKNPDYSFNKSVKALTYIKYDGYRLLKFRYSRN